MNPGEARMPNVASARYVLLPLANALTGYSVKAMERKIERGDWTEGKVWRRAPDGRILIDLVGYQKWVESARSLAGRRDRPTVLGLPLDVAVT